MADFMLNVFAEIADFCIDFWADKVIDRFAKKEPWRVYRRCRKMEGRRNGKLFESRK